MNQKNSDPIAVPATSFRIESGVLILSGPSMAEMQVPLSQILAWVDIGQGRVQTFSLVRTDAPSLDIQDPDGSLEDLLSGALPKKFEML